MTPLYDFPCCPLLQYETDGSICPKYLEIESLSPPQPMFVCWKKDAARQYISLSISKHFLNNATMSRADKNGEIGEWGNNVRDCGATSTRLVYCCSFDEQQINLAPRHHLCQERKKERKSDTGHSPCEDLQVNISGWWNGTLELELRG
jgi:hypothetical protein